MLICRLVLVAAAMVTLFVGLVLSGGSSVGCLGPIGVTHVQCIAAFNAAHEPDYSPGPADGAWMFVGLALTLVAAAFMGARLPSIRSIAGLAAMGVAGGIMGAVVYAITRETSLTGPTSSGAIITVTFPLNAATALWYAAIGFGLAVLVAAIAVSVRARRRARVSPVEDGRRSIM